MPGSRMDPLVKAWLLASLAAWTLDPAMDAIARSRVASGTAGVSGVSFALPVAHYEGEEPVVEVVAEEGGLVRALRFTRSGHLWRREVGWERSPGVEQDDMTALGRGLFGWEDYAGKRASIVAIVPGRDPIAIAELPHRMYGAASLEGGELWYGHQTEKHPMRWWVRQGDDAGPVTELPDGLMPAVLWDPDGCMLVGGAGDRCIALCPEDSGLRIVERDGRELTGSAAGNPGSQTAGAASLDGVVIVGVPVCGEVQLGYVEEGKLVPLHRSIPFDDAAMKCVDRNPPLAMTSAGDEALLAYVSRLGGATATHVSAVRSDGTIVRDERLTSEDGRFGERALAASASGAAVALARLVTPSVARREIELWERRGGVWVREAIASSAEADPRGTILTEAMSWVELVGADPLRPAPLVLAMALGSAQALVLRGRLPLAWLWIPLTALGRPVGALLALLLRRATWPFREAMGYGWVDVPLWTGFGLGMGLMQWLFLRRLGARSRSWILVSTLAYVAGGTFQSFLAHGVPYVLALLPGSLAPRAGWIIATKLEGLGIAIVAAAVTGLFLARLLRAGSEAAPRHSS